MKNLKALFELKKKTGGRNNRGKITAYHRGGGSKLKYRKINFNFNNCNINDSFLVLDFQHDPNRNAGVMLVQNLQTKKLEFRLRLENIRIGDTFLYNTSTPSVGNFGKLKDFPLNSEICCVENKPKTLKGCTYIRSGGSSGLIINKYFKNKVLIKLPSGFYKFFHEECFAVFGKIFLPKLSIKKKKAGRTRWLGIRPTVRGVAMNPIDHPHGGGEGKTSGGRCSVSPWGVLTKGYKTKKRQPLSKIKNKEKLFEAKFNIKMKKKLK